ncbi:hypothetical protein HPB52_009061 [Rhipicephalus sanguineus]|uniref:Endonuclease/exonuclease/phosphatase domain-containing protein n=1 Tax=Rhipicephalus sanguineus TaxID=34632 RepID=A0A9D4PYZ0_RHISA|nr:hypothetical protein HPB52_009061 [Rhipicephalus sanguineus]
MLLGDINCVVSSQRDLSGPGQGRSTYHAKELVKVLRHFNLSDAWVHLHNDLFVPTRTSSSTASRIDRTYLADYLLSSVVACEVLAPPSDLAEKSDHLPLTTTLRGFPGPRNGNPGWRIDPNVLQDEDSVKRVRDPLRESLENAPPMTPQGWDILKETWKAILQRSKAILQEEGRARKCRPI